MNVNYLPDAGNHPLWPHIEALLEPAALLGGVTVDPDEVIWIAHENGIVFGAAESVLWDDGDAELLLAGGTRFKEWIGPLDEVVSAWAKSTGATKLTMRGRKGWARYARAFGWVALGEDEDKLTMFEKDLSGNG